MFPLDLPCIRADFWNDLAHLCQSGSTGPFIKMIDQTSIRASGTVVLVTNRPNKVVSIIMGDREFLLFN